jgi:hypothetical protein
VVDIDASRQSPDHPSRRCWRTRPEGPASVAIGTAALAVLLQPKVKVPEPAVVLAAAVVGVVAFG